MPAEQTSASMPPSAAAVARVTRSTASASAHVERKRERVAADRGLGVRRAFSSPVPERDARAARGQPPRDGEIRCPRRRP